MIHRTPLLLITSFLALQIFTGSVAALTMQDVNNAGWSEPAEKAQRRPSLVKAQVLLDRLHLSPGAIDGYWGGNTRKALREFQRQQGLEVSGRLDRSTWQQLLQTGSAGIIVHYTITPEDVAGPFLAEVPEEARKQAKLKAMSYTSALELLAEKFHATEGLMKALNTGKSFSRAGEVIVVPQVSGDPPVKTIARIVVDKGNKAVGAFDEAGKMVAFFPATIGSRSNPAPSGTYQIRAIALNPVWYYGEDLDFKKTEGTLEIPPGPNNPVGTMWLDLTKEHYGIHGTPEPAKIGKTFSHGCIRLTNWDVIKLSKMVEPGKTPVAFTD